MKIIWKDASGKQHDTQIMITAYLSSGGYEGRSEEYNISTRGKDIRELARVMTRRIDEKMSENESQ